MGDERPPGEREPTGLPGLLIDLDGVIYQSDRIIAGALQTLDWIRQQQIPHLFVTNTTSRSRAALLEKFEQFGFDAEFDELMTPIVAANQYLERQQFGKIAAFVTASAVCEFSGVEVVSPQSGQAVDAVVIGDLGDAWDYQRLNGAFRLLMQDPAPQLIALGMTRYWRGADGLRLDVAPFDSALENAAACKAMVFGKPAAAFFAAALERLQCSADEVFMIGDDIAGDTDAAQRCGIRAIQVKTGKFREADLQGDIVPFALLDSVADLPQWWARNIDDPAGASG
ncbi:MAG: TIGR01458 family HAD-type hydrolase [Gammaproteobacteria bacterium]|nr:TIGR01458 family HAD-type hydrolase [Gammaproteobacteria bacterium]